MKLATHFGAGNIGRAFIGEILQKNNYHINFVDTNEHVINELNRRDEYVIHYLNEKKTTSTIRNFSGINSKDHNAVIESMLKSDLITISIGASNLKYIFNSFIEFIKLKKSTNDRKLVNVVCAENGIKISSELKKMILSAKPEIDLTNVAFVDAAVDKIVPEQHNESIDVSGEEFYEFALDKNLWIGEKLNFVDYYDDISPVLERKLFMLNGTHSLISWAGFGKYKLVNEFQDFPEIKAEVLEYIDAIAHVVSKKFNWDIAEIKKYAKKTIKRFENRTIFDSIDRTGRNVQRKVRLNERIVSPLIFAFENNLDYKPMIKALLRAYAEKDFQDEEYVEIKNFISVNGLEKAINKFSSIDGELLKVIMATKI